LLRGSAQRLELLADGFGDRAQLLRRIPCRIAPDPRRFCDRARLLGEIACGFGLPALLLRFPCILARITGCALCLLGLSIERESCT
jgi:hypothetical protein